jgi:hypothetical protein
VDRRRGADRLGPCRSAASSPAPRS